MQDKRQQIQFKKGQQISKIASIYLQQLNKLMWNCFLNLSLSCPIVKLQNTQNLIKREQPYSKVQGLKKQKKQKSKKKKIEDDQYYVKRRQQHSTLIRWSKDEDLLYIGFLKSNQKYFSCQNLRRTSKVFMHLSVIMGGKRTPNQCKSHHQKMQKATKNGTVQQIIEYLQHKHSIVVDNEQKVQTKQLIKTAPDYQSNKYRDYLISRTINENELEIMVTLNLQRVSNW